MPGFGKSGICRMCALRSIDDPPPSSWVGRGSDGTPAAGRQVVTRRRLLRAAALLLAAAGLPTMPAAAFAQGELTIATGTGRHRFTVELAQTSAERARGLMFRERMPADHGMLFDFVTERPVSFWMKNTPLPLDMLFIDAQGVVVRIVADAVPFSEVPIPSGRPVRAVLELNAGTAARLGIVPGARVLHPLFGTG
jgi:uncharacterized membrane protein (UPF0127 family)